MKAPYYDLIKHLKISKKNIHLLSKNDIVFLHIGKNAGTQVKHLSEQINRVQNRIKILNFGHKCKLTDIPVSTRYFFSVRDPITRFKSGFYSRKRKGQPRLYNEWSPEEEVAFSDFEHANDLAEALFRNDELGRKAFWAMMSIRHVRNHQVDWFANTGYFLLDRKPVHIIRQENFEFDFKHFMKKSGLNFELDSLNLAKDNKTAHSFDYNQTPDISELAKANLNVWYKRDFEFYKACVNWLTETINE